MNAVMIAPVSVSVSPVLMFLLILVFSVLPVVLFLIAHRQDINSQHARQIAGALLIAVVLGSLTVTVDAAVLYWPCEWTIWC